MAVEGLLSLIPGEFSSRDMTSGKVLMGLSSEGSMALKAGSFRLARISAPWAAILWRVTRISSNNGEGAVDERLRADVMFTVG